MSEIKTMRLLLQVLKPLQYLALVVMKMLILVSVILLNGIAPINAQSGITPQPDAKHIVIVKNKNNIPIKELYAGDMVRLRLTNSSKVKGVIMSIDSALFIVSNQQVRFDEIKKISTKKGWVRGVGGAFLVMGIGLVAASNSDGATIYVTTFTSLTNEDIHDFTWPGIALIGAGTVMLLPAYHDLGKFRLMVISSKPNYISQSF